MHAAGEAGLPQGTFVFREFYCTDDRCDCRRVILQVQWAERQRVIASLNFALAPGGSLGEQDPPLFLDPLNPQSELAEHVLVLFEEMIASDRAYPERLMRHYRMWKRAVDDPKHPQHRKLVSLRKRTA